MIVWLAAYPRSGVTFLRHVITELYDLTTCSVYPDTPDVLLDASGGQFPDRFTGDPRQGVFPVKTHEQDHALTCWPAIHLVRDGRDAMCSHAHYRRYREGDTRPFDRVLKNLVLAPDWSIHTQIWANRDAPTARVRYEDLIAEPVATVRAAFAELGLSGLPEQEAEIKSFAEINQVNPQLYRHGKTGAWRIEMPRAVQALFWSQHREAMALLDYGSDQA